MKARKLIAILLAFALVFTSINFTGINFTSVASAVVTPKFAKTRKNVYIGKSYTYKVKNLKEGYYVKWTLTGDGKSGASLSASATTVQKSQNSASVKLKIKSSSDTDISFKVKAVVYNSKTSKKALATLKDKVTVKCDATDLEIMSSANEYKAGNSYKLSANLTPSTATSEVYWTVEDASGNDCSTYISNDGTFTPQKSGTYMIKVEAKRTYNSDILTKDALLVVVGEGDTPSVPTGGAIATPTGGAVTTPTGGTITTPTQSVITKITASQTGAKKITIQTDAINITSKPSIAVRKDNIVVVLAYTNPIVTNGSTIEVTTVNNLTDGNYTVTVNGSMTATFAARTEVVNEIKIDSSNLALVSGSTTQGTVDYKVYNQFGEDLTNTANLTVTVSSADPSARGTITSKGTVLYSGSKALTINQVITIILIHNETGRNVSKALTVSEAAKLNSIVIERLYNVNSHTINEDTNLSTDLFYLVLNCKDQYGNEITANNAGITNVNNNIYKLTTGVTGIDVGDAQLLSVNGVTRIVMPLKFRPGFSKLNAFTETITLVCTSATNTVSNTAQYVIDIGIGSKVDTFTISMPSVVVAGETVKFDFTAHDSNGKDVSESLAGCTSKNLKNKFQLIPDNFEFVLNSLNGKVELIYKAPYSANDTILPIIFVSGTGKQVLLTTTIKASSVPTLIYGIEGVETAVLAVTGQTITVKQENLVIYDQYGRKMSKEAIAACGKNGANTVAASKNYGIKMVPTDTTSTVLSVPSTTVPLGSNPSTTIMTATTPSSTPVEGTKIVQFYITQNGTVLDGSVYTATFATASLGNIVANSYTVDSIPNLYVAKEPANAKAYAADINVYGKTNTGYTIRIPASQYAVIPVTDNILTQTTGTRSSIYFNSMKYDGITGPGSSLYASLLTTEKINIVLNGTGATLTRDITLNKEAPRVSNVSLKDASVGISIPSTYFNSGDSAYNMFRGDFSTNILSYMNFKDQYGKDISLASIDGHINLQFADGSRDIPKVTITDVTDAIVDIYTPTWANNGTSNISLKNFAAGDTCKATFAFTGGVAFQVLVTII